MTNGDLSIKNGPKHETLLLCLLSVIIILIYAETLTTPFIFDDIGSIRDNPHIRLPALNFRNLAWAGFHSPLANRPIANISFALNHYVHGYNLVGFHAVNIIIHIITGVGLYFLVKATIRLPALRSCYAKFSWIPFFTAFIWLVHPLQTQSVTYLVQRMNSMAAMFYVLSMLLYVKFRLTTRGRAKWPFFGGCIFCGILAFGTKEIAATLPVFIILYEWYFFQELSSQWAKRHLLIVVGVGFVIFLIALIYFGNEPFTHIMNSYRIRDFTLTQRVLTQFRVIIFYISLLIWPQPGRLNLDHDFALSYSLTNPITTALAMTMIIALILAAILIAKREPLISFGIFWFFGNLLIESSIIGLELVFEHRNYLPSMLVIFLVVALVFRYLKPAWLGAITLCVIGTLFSVWTFDRNKDWSDEITLYRDCVLKSPAKARPHNNLGAALIRRGRLAEAVEQFELALKIRPDSVDAHYNLGYAFAQQGDLTKAIDYFGKTLRLDPDNVRALNNMGVALVLQNRHAEATHYFESALKLSPRDADVHNNLGFALKNNGEPDAAVRHFSKALALDSGHAGAHNNLGLILKDNGQIEAARHHFKRALEINPKFDEARRNLESIAGQTAEVRGQMSDDRIQMTDDRGQAR